MNAVGLKTKRSEFFLFTFVVEHIDPFCCCYVVHLKGRICKLVNRGYESSSIRRLSLRFLRAGCLLDKYLETVSRTKCLVQ